MKKVIEHIHQQPLHITLKQYRLISIAAIVFSGWFMLEVWEFYKLHVGKLSEYELVALFGFLGALLGTFKFSIDNIKDKHED
jgi:hypothetical protein